MIFVTAAGTAPGQRRGLRGCAQADKNAPTFYLSGQSWVLLTTGDGCQQQMKSIPALPSGPPQPPSPYEVTAATNRALLMKIERFCYHHEARDALVLSVAGVTAIMLIESLILLILY